LQSFPYCFPLTSHFIVIPVFFHCLSFEDGLQNLAEVGLYIILFCSSWISLLHGWKIVTPSMNHRL
jgi:hypothetical protein